MKRAGITRVARVTDLDRAGVEVACAVRPEGHVLQVSQGKGRDFKSAVLSSVYEAVELWAAENPREENFIWSSANTLRAQEFETWTPRDLNLLAAPELWHDELKLPWVWATRIDERSKVLVPAQVLYCAPKSRADLGLLVSHWSSNGMGASPVLKNAVRHGVLELLERHALTLTLPHAWAMPSVFARRRSSNLKLVKQLRELHFEVAIYDLTPDDWPLAVAGALLRDLTNPTTVLTSGYACRLTKKEAFESALYEAAQSRLTEIHGAREDISQKGDNSKLADVFFSLPETTASEFMRKTMPEHAPFRMAYVDLAPANSKVHVVKVFSPDTQVSSLLS